MTDSSLVLRDVVDSDIKQLVLMNRDAVPAVNDIDEDEFRWFKNNASYFRVAVFEDSADAGEQTRPGVGGFLIVLEPGREYASTNYQWFCGNYDSFAYVDRIVVDDAFKGKRVGSRLYEDLIKWAEPRAPRITCEVNKRPPNPVSMAFHERFGFIEVGEQQTEGGKKTVALLSRELAA